MINEDVFYCLALQSVPGIGPVNARKLINYCGGVKEIFEKGQDLKKRIKGISSRTLNELNNSALFKKAERELIFLEKNKASAVSINDQSYPDRLKNCTDAPLVLFQRGAIDVKDKKIISIVGTRRMTKYGREFLKNFLGEIKIHNPIIVSGLAYGVDGCAHEEALNNNLSTVAVLAHGLDRIYPSSHKRLSERMIENGGLYTEFWSGSIPERINFVKRNRIIAGLSEATIVVESAEKGGSLITADLAASYHRDVFAVPGRLGDPYSRGCNYLIKHHKAALISSVKDLEYLLGWNSLQVEKNSFFTELIESLGKKEKAFYDYLLKADKILLDQLALETGLSIQSTLTLLLQLELKGLVNSYPGKYYEANRF